MTSNFYCMIIDCFFFIIFCFLFIVIRTTLFRFCRFFNCESTNCADIAISAVPVAIAILCIVPFIEMNIMMIACRTFVHNTWDIINSATLRTTFFCISITSTECFCYSFIIMITSCSHFKSINKNSTPHELVIVVRFFAISHFSELFITVTRILRIIAVIWIIITFLILITIVWNIIYRFLTWNESKIGSNRYIHMTVFFNCHCCNRTIRKGKGRFSFTFTACCKRHTSKRIGIITFSRYFIVFFYDGNRTGWEFITKNTITQIEVYLTIIHSSCEHDRWINITFFFILRK